MPRELALERLRRVHLFAVVQLAGIRLFWVAVLTALALVYLDVLFQFENLARFLLDLGLLALLLAAAWLTHRWHTRSASRERMLARMVEQGNPELHNDLVSAIDFGESLTGKDAVPVSRELMSRQIAVASAKVAGLQKLDALRPPSLKKESWALGGAVALAAGLVVAMPNVFRAVAPRYLDPFGDHPPYNQTQLKVDPAGTRVDFGENLKVTVTITGRRPRTVSLVLEDLKGKQLAEMPMFEAGADSWFQTIENVREDLVYLARIPRGRSHRYLLSVNEWPKIESVIVAYRYPEYTRLPSETRQLQEEGIKGYQDTRVTVTIAANKPLKGGMFTVCGTEHPFSPADARSVQATFQLSTNGTFSGFITDPGGNRGRDKLAGPVTIVPDEKPEVAIVDPGMDSYAIATARVPINIEARDDLGIARVEIVRSFNGSANFRKAAHVGDGREKFVNVIEELNLAELGVRPGDVLDYHATATDTNPSPPQTAASPSYRLAIISDDQYRELVQGVMTAEDLAEKYKEMLEKMEKLAEQQEALQKETSQLRDTLQEKGALSSEQMERLAKAEARQQDLARKTEQLRQELKEEVESPAIFDIEKDYKKALEKFADRLGQARDAMNKSEQSLDRSGNPSAGQQSLAEMNNSLQEQKRALENLGRNMDEFKEGIAQANQDIQNVADLLQDVERFKQLFKRQESLERHSRTYKETTEPEFEDRARMSELSEEQKSAQEDLEQLKKDLEEHAGKVEKNYPEVAGDARKIGEQIGKREIGKSMKAGSEQLGKGQGKGGYPDVSRAYQQMAEMIEFTAGMGGPAPDHCKVRLKIQMGMNLGKTFGQLSKGFMPGEGHGQGEGGSGMGTFGLYGSEPPKGRKPAKAGMGRRSSQSQTPEGQPDPVATSIEELTSSKDKDRKLDGGRTEHFVEEYRKLTEEYFRRLAEDE